MGPQDVIAVRGDGAEVTVQDRVTETLKVGLFLHDAAARIGIGQDTLRRWITEGTRLSRDILSGRRTNADLDMEERNRIGFAQAVAEAEAEGKMILMGLAHRLSVGGMQVEEITVTEHEPIEPIFDQDGHIVLSGRPGHRDVRTTTKTTLPDPTMIRWRLERRWPEDFGRATRLEVSGPGGGPLEIEDRTPTDVLLEKLRRMTRQREAIEAESVEDESPGQGAIPEESQESP